MGSFTIMACSKIVPACGSGSATTDSKDYYRGCLRTSLLQVVESQDIRPLCGLFDKALQSLGTGMVVCVINEVDLFENETLLAGLDSAMRYLSSLVQAFSRIQSGITFKLLLTSLMNIENFRNWFLEAVELALLVSCKLTLKRISP
ncbi:hypothetical protein F4815DRAFT_446737 [Daldinia loculata]|nr:hypothetical protein F4815DRAFT_446737 [Daldinia loculata]